MPKPCVRSMFSLDKWQDLQAGTQRLLQHDEDPSDFQDIPGLRTVRLEQTELLLTAVDKMWQIQENLVPEGILGLIVFLSDTCFSSWLQVLAENPHWMCAAQKTDGLVAGGLLDSRRWFEWGVDTHEFSAAEIWQPLRDTEESPGWVGSCAEAFKPLLECTWEEAPRHWWKWHWSVYPLSQSKQVFVTMHSLTWWVCLMCVSGCVNRARH